MRIFVVDVFTQKRFQGNQAGVVLLPPGESFPQPGFMLGLAGELKHSETVFVRHLGGNSYQLRYFTPETELPLCGHATIAAFSVLREEGGCAPGKYLAEAGAGSLEIQMGPERVWMDMAPARLIRRFEEAETEAMYAAFGLEANRTLPAELLSTGLADILLPVKDRRALDRARMDRDRVKALSEEYDTVGFHLFSLGEGATAHCRNFAPRVGIDEECATGTANGALTHYLFRLGKIRAGEENRILQGRAMGRPSEILTRIDEDGRVQVGGSAVISLRCCL